MKKQGPVCYMIERPWAIQVAFFLEDSRCWGAWDTTCGHKAKHITPLILWRREAWKEEALDDLPWKDERGPSWVGWTLELFQMHCWGNFWKMGGLFQVHRYYLERNWSCLMYLQASCLSTPPKLVIWIQRDGYHAGKGHTSVAKGKTRGKTLVSWTESVFSFNSLENYIYICMSDLVCFVFVFLKTLFECLILGSLLVASHLNFHNFQFVDIPHWNKGGSGVYWYHRVHVSF